MVNVIPFTRKRNKNTEPEAPRHRRDGWFDDQDQWHPADEQGVAATSAAH